jgi:hypothetical protein
VQYKSIKRRVKKQWFDIIKGCVPKIQFNKRAGFKKIVYTEFAKIYGTAEEINDRFKLVISG